MARVYAISDPTEVDDPGYVDGLRVAASEALNFALDAIGHPERRQEPLPIELPRQARQAARTGVGLDTVLRRYLAGHALLGEFLIAEAGAESLATHELQRLNRVLAGLLERILVEVSRAHCLETRGGTLSGERARLERVRKLLAGEVVDALELGYRLDAWHLAAVATGPGCRQVLAALAGQLDRQLLLVPAGDGSLWAWLGGARRADLGEVVRIASAHMTGDVSIAFGEPGRALRGWRLTHRQAAAAAAIARRSRDPVTCYADVALLASIWRDDLLVTSLRQTYLSPLEGDNGAMLRETAGAYLSTGENISSTAAALGVSRKTVASRLRTLEECLGRPLSACRAEMDAALRLADLESPTED